MRWSLLFVPPLLLPACKDEKSPQTRFDGSETFEQVPPSPVDILWIVDDSVSMQEEQLKVQEGSGQFVEKLDDAAVDFQLAVTTTDIPGEAGSFIGDPPILTPEDDDYADQFRDRVGSVGLAGDDEESGLEAAALALTTTAETNQGFLRADAKLAIIVLSDEDDCSEFGVGFTGSHDTSTCTATATRDLLTPVDEIVQMYVDLKGDAADVQVSGITGVELGRCDATPGDRYIEAARLTNGLSADICEADYESIMDELGLRAAGALFQFELAHEAYDGTIVVWTQPEDGTSYEVPEDRRDGWTYTSSPPVVTFHGDAIPPRGSSITISYQY